MLRRITYRRHSEVTGISSLLAPGVCTDVVVALVRDSEGAAGGRGGGARCRRGLSAGRLVVQVDDAVVELLKLKN